MYPLPSKLARLSKRAKSEQARVAAMGMLLDRAHGKAPQSVNLSGALAVDNYNLTTLSDEELDPFEALARKVTLGDAGEGKM